MAVETLESKNILLCVAVDQICMDLLKCNGIQVETKLNLCEKKLCDIVKDYNAVIVSSNTKLTAEIFKAGTVKGGKLRAVGRACGGVDNIDVVAARNHSVVVLNPPGRRSISAFSLLCLVIRALTSPFTPVSTNVEATRWSQKLYGGIMDIAYTSREVTGNLKVWAWGSLILDAIAEEDAHAQGIEAEDLNTLWTKAESAAVHAPFI